MMVNKTVNVKLSKKVRKWGKEDISRFIHGSS